MKILDVPQSGSIGGVTSSHNRAGQYRRSRRTPVSPTRTPKQGVARARFGAASSLWQSMSSVLQAAWTAFAQNYPVVDSLGQSIVLTGQQYFVGINAQLQACGQPTTTVVPTNTTLFPIDTPVIYADDSGTVIASVNSVNEGDFNKVSLSSVKSNGVSFNKQFSQFAVLENDTLIVDISAAYVAQYGVPGTARKIFADLVFVNSSGMNGNDAVISVPVVPASAAAAPVLTNHVAGTVVSTGPGAGTDRVALFKVNPEDGYATIQNQETEVAGVATFPFVPVGSSVFSRTLIAGVWGPKSNVINPTI